MENEFFERAIRLHKENVVVDAHLDLPGEILHRKNNGERDIIRKYYEKDWESAGVNIVFASVFVESNCLPEMGLRNALNQIAVIKEEVRNNDKLLLITDKIQLERVCSENKTGVLLYVEGLDFIGNDISLLEVLHDLGVRGAALCWSRDNQLATGCCKALECVQKYGGLTAFGIRVVERMEELGIFLDVSHLNDDGFEEVALLARKPFIASHSCSRSVHFHYRNLTDEQLVKLARQGGVVGINGCRMIAGVKSRDEAVEKLCRHISHICRLTGAESVGLGLDFCDSYDCARYKRMCPLSPDDSLENYGQLVEVTAKLLKEGMSETDVVKIIGGNFYEFLRMVLA